MLKGCASFLKYFMFTFNLLVFIFSLVLIIFGSLLHSGANVNETFLPIDAKYVTIAIIIIVVFAFLCGFLGCWGAIRESSGLLMVYAFLLLLVVIAEIAAGAYAVSNKDKIKDEVKKIMTKKIFSSILSYGKNDTKGRDATDAWDNLQSELECCGAESYTNWNLTFGLLPVAEKLNISVENVDVTKYLGKKSFQEVLIEIANDDKTSDKDKATLLMLAQNQTALVEMYKNDSSITDLLQKPSQKLPNSCCPNKVECLVSDDKFYKKPCLQAAKEFGAQYATKLGIVAIVIGVIELSGIIVSCFVAYQIRQNENDPQKRQPGGSDGGGDNQRVIL